MRTRKLLRELEKTRGRLRELLDKVPKNARQRRKLEAQISDTRFGVFVLKHQLDVNARRARSKR